MYFNRDDDGMRISFRCIDSKHPKRRFYVVLKINQEEKWEGGEWYVRWSLVIRTKPELSSIGELTMVLNQTNDINAFLRNVRKQFRREFCENESPLYYVC